MINECLLCGRKLRQVSAALQAHPRADDCLVKMTDRWGVAVDDIPKIVIESDQEDKAEDEIELEVFPSVEKVLIDVFKSLGLERLGGISTGRGWSMVSTYQRCAHAFRRRYIDPPERAFLGLHTERASLAIGTLIHTFLAVYYQRCIVPDYPLTPNQLRDLVMKQANPELVEESWRVFYAYCFHYQHEEIMPLAVEYGLRDPRTGESCRYDLIAYFPNAIESRLPGTYILEHKSSGRFDDDTLDGWGNDGEILGEVLHWKRLGLDRRFGPLVGVIVNILGKHKEPKFHRTIVSPDSFLIDQHASDLRKWDARIQMSIAGNDFPRSRSGCINRYGRCEWYAECRGDFR